MGSSKEKQEKNKLKRNLEEDIPCMKERELSSKCLSDNNYNHDACKLYFDNYNNCNKFWDAVYRDRRHKNIRPLLPPIDEREQVRQEYLAKFNIRL
ncbi:coiled-coil-helix-coiled-coil-helix domain-containing protein 7 [Prorops nasuta]|uniref:coiled-coil-helix-coiled-coil-helix domain-containing protein 7 n=1 Tax=Prorops nasuta TaxID=863751 RepID=UPI0034CE85E1